MEENKVLERTEFSFRKGKGKGKVKTIYAITEIIEESIRQKGGKMYVCFADLKAEFDNLKRKCIRRNKSKDNK